MFSHRSFAIPALAGLLACILAAPVFAQAYDPPSVVATQFGHGKIKLRVTAGPSGAPQGFTVYWMAQDDFDASGNIWPTSPFAARLGWAAYEGTPTLNTDGGRFDSFRLAPGEVIEVEVGDLIDETGVTANDPYELFYARTFGERYAFTVFANAGAGAAASEFSVSTTGTTTPVVNCTYTLGYWKTHPTEWPVANLTLGTVSYTKAQLLLILNTAVKGNGLVSLAHQLIAAKLNLNNGASPISASAAISAADALIGALVVPPIGAGYLQPGTTSGWTQVLDDFNNGIIGPGHCGDTAAGTSTWGGLKLRYR